MNRTKVRAPAAYDDPMDRASAVALFAFFAGEAVCVVFVAEFAARAVNPAVVARGITAEINAFFEHSLHGGKKRFHFFRRDF